LDAPRARAAWCAGAVAREGGGGEVLSGVWEYDRDLFDPATVVRLGDQLTRLLAAAVAEPEARIGDLPLLSTGESQRLLEWGQGDAEPTVSPGVCLHELFRARAALHPEAEALIGGEE